MRYEDKKSGFGLMGPTWIHDALSFTVSEDKKSVAVRSHYFTTKNESPGKAIRYIKGVKGTERRAIGSIR